MSSPLVRTILPFSNSCSVSCATPIHVIGTNRMAAATMIWRTRRGRGGGLSLARTRGPMGSLSEATPSRRPASSAEKACARSPVIVDAYILR